ncbi:hypothetical protein MMC31_004640 [Peltigera leucophlebia]|nr:hypothetical protein [Peltigera leucophlebia]
MIFCLLFLLLIILGAAGSSDIDFQDGEVSYDFGAEPNSALLTSEPQDGAYEFGLVATEPPYAVGSSEGSLIQNNNDGCPYDPAQPSRKMQSKRESRICYPPSTRNSLPSVQGSGHNPSEKDPKDNHETPGEDPQGNAQTNRNSAPAEENDCATIPSAAIPVCAVVSADHIRLNLVSPSSGLSSGWWQLEYSRSGTYTPPPYHLSDQIFAIILPGSDIEMPVKYSHKT